MPIVAIIQLYSGNHFYLIRYEPRIDYKNLKTILSDGKITKIFHHANFDVRFLQQHLGVTQIQNIVCTKIAAKLLRGIGEKNSLRDLVKDYLGVFLDKTLQTSDWGTSLSPAQIQYAFNDVRYLFELWAHLEDDLKEKRLIDIAYSCYSYVSTQALLENKGIKNIFEY